MKTRFEKLQQEHKDLKERNFEYENDFKDMENQQINYCSKIAQLEFKIQEFENDYDKSKTKNFLQESIANYKSKIQQLENEKSKNKKFMDETIANFKSKIQVLEDEKSKNKKFFEETIANYTTTAKSNTSKQSPTKKDQYQGSRSSKDPRRHSDVNYQNLDMDIVSSNEGDNLTIKKSPRKSDEHSNHSKLELKKKHF